ncbi:hypothetical protein PS2_032059 [Malus domestica]
MFWLLLHGLISLFLGFLFSRLVFFFLFSTSFSKLYPAPFRTVADLTVSNLELPANPIEVSLKQTKKPCQSRWVEEEWVDGWVCGEGECRGEKGVRRSGMGGFAGMM